MSRAESRQGDRRPEKAPRCRLCGRPLRSQASRVAGVGPVCFRRSQAHPRPPGAVRSLPVTETPPIPGQAELPLTPFQPTLEAI